MSPAGNKRPERVAQLIQEELARLLVDGVHDPRVGFVTVTEVRASPDLRSARVYVSILGDDAQVSTTLAGLHDAAGFLQRELGHRLSLRYTPSLTFTQDTTLEHAARLDALLAGHDGPAAPEAIPAPVTPRSDMAATAAVLERQPPPHRDKRHRPRRRAGRPTKD